MPGEGCVCPGKGCVCPEGVSAERGCLPRGGVCLGRGVSAWGVSPQRVSAWGVSDLEGLPRAVSARGCLPGGQGVCLGVSTWGRGLSVPVHAGIHSPLWTEFLTYACENITFQELRLRTVKIVAVSDIN